MTETETDKQTGGYNKTETETGQCLTPMYVEWQTVPSAQPPQQQHNTFFFFFFFFF